MSNLHTALTVAVMSFVTILLRFAPFLFLKGRKTPAWVSYLGKVLPFAVMGMLVVYCLKGVSFGSAAGFWPELIAGAAVVLSYIWKRNTLISIVGGTVIYMLLVQQVFI